MSGLDSTERGFLLCIGTPALLLAGFGSAAKFSIGERRTGCWRASCRRAPSAFAAPLPDGEDSRSNPLDGLTGVL